jgi:hypothetical protein
MSTAAEKEEARKMMIGTCMHKMLHIAYCVTWKENDIVEHIVICAKCYHDDFRYRKGLLNVYKWVLQRRRNKSKRKCCRDSSLLNFGMHLIDEMKK